MPNSSQIRSSNFSKLAISAVALICAVSLVAQHAQGTSSPKYDVQTELKMKGTVEEVTLPPNPKEVVHLVVKTDAGSADVFLSPKSFLDDMGVSFSKGDQITLTGSKVKQNDADLILAREIVKGNDTLVLRDAKGNPIWS